MSTALLITSSAEHTVLSGSIPFVLRGAWSARLEVDADEDAPLVAGTCTLVLGADNEGEPVELVGTIRPEDVGTFEGRAQCVIVAGAGAAGTLALPARTYQQAPLPSSVIDIVRDAIEEAGEVIGVVELSATVARWHRVGGRTASQLLDRIADRFAVSWRYRDDGAIDLSADTWPAVDEEEAGLLVEGPEDAVTRTLAVTVGRASIRPGTTLRGRRVEEVVYLLEEGEPGIRAQIRFGPGTGRGGLREDFVALSRESAPPIDYRELHAATVRRQNADGTLDLDAGDQRIGGITGVPYLPGVVGARLVIDEGRRVLLGFAGGDEAQPFATAWDALPAGEGLGVARRRDEVDVGSLQFVGAPDGQGGLLSVVVTYTPPTGTPQTGTITSAGVPVTINLLGAISTASTKIYIEGS